MRDYCEHCQYPQSQCICDAVVPFMVAPQISIIQHPKERRHAKNTARLVTLCLPHTQLVSSDDAPAMRSLEALCGAKNTALVYPAATSRPIEHERSAISTINHWVFLDGSWKQAFALYQQLPFLKRLPSYHFDNAPASHYTIRHTQVEQSLSTLEAVAYCLRQTGEQEADRLLSLQQALVDRWRGPASHRRKPQR